MNRTIPRANLGSARAHRRDSKRLLIVASPGATFTLAGTGINASVVSCAPTRALIASVAIAMSFTTMLPPRSPSRIVRRRADRSA